MFASSTCNFRSHIDVYLNGKKVDDAIQADEEAGKVWAGYRNSEGKIVPELEAENGALICEGLQVIILTGKVEIRVASIDGLADEYVRQVIAETSTPIEITTKSGA